jgi:hypothetical protein
VLLLLFIIGAGVKSLSSGGKACILGATCHEGDAPLAEFAVIDARGPLHGDANVAQDDCSTPQLPCPSSAQRTPACDVKGAGIIRICDFFDRPLVISFWFTRGGNCDGQQDVVDRVASRYRGRVNFLSLDIRDSRSTVRKLIAERGWRLPVGIDSDGAVSNIYGVGGCPTFAYALPGGILQSASIGDLKSAALDRHVRALIDASRRREQTSR